MSLTRFTEVRAQAYSEALMTTDDLVIDADLVSRLVAAQFPHWADLDVQPVPEQGWDNRTFRLGGHLSVRMPSADGYVEGLLREEQTLAFLGPALRVAVPTVVASGHPSEAFPRPWSVRAWIDGRTLRSVPQHQRATAIAEIGSVLAELQRCGTDGGGWAGPSSAYRGCHVSAVGESMSAALAAAPARLREHGARLWSDAVRTVWRDDPVWVHGDVAPGNMLFDDDGHLVALLDVGQTCIGDPACDLGFAWLGCGPEERITFRRALPMPDDAWLRGAAWALWKTLITDSDRLVFMYGRDRESILRDIIANVG